MLYIKSIFIFGSFVVLDSKSIRYISPLTLLGLAACSSGGNNAAQNFNIGGIAAKGPLQNATAFLDANSNNILDAGETSVTTLADGSYTLSSNSATARVVVISTDETIDTSSGAAVTNLVMSAPAGATMVTPLTTLIDASPDLTVEELQTALGIDVDPLTFNPFGAGVDNDQAVAAEKAAQQIASVITTTTKLTGSDATAFTQSVKALATALDTGARVDLSDAAVIESVIDTAATAQSVTISEANKTAIANSVSNVNKVLEDTLVSGVNLTSNDIKNALATVNQFTDVVAAIDTSALEAGNADVGGFDDIEKVKAAVANAAPTDISLSGLLITADSDSIGTAIAIDADSTDIVYSLAGDDKAFFTIHADTGAISVDKTVNGYADKSEFSIVIKATDYTDANNNEKFDAGDTKGKSYVEGFTIVKQNPDALVISEALTLNDYDVANNSQAAADDTSLTGTVSDGTFYVASDAVKLNLKNLEALANGTGGSAPSFTLTLADLPDTEGETKTATFNVTLIDGSDSSADAGERVISLDFEMEYSSDGTDLSLGLPAQTVTGYFVRSDGTRVEIEASNASADALVLSGGALNSPSTLDLKVSSLIDLAKEYASVDLLKAGEFNLSLTASKGIELQSSGGEAISKVEMGINIVDEGEIFQASANSVTLAMGGDSPDEIYTVEASGGVLAVTDAIELEESQVKAMASGAEAFPDISIALSKLANSDSTAKVRLSLIDGSDATVSTGERSISFDVDLNWDASESTFTLGSGTINGTVVRSSGDEVEVTLTNADADVLSVSSGSNSVSGASLSVKLDQLVKASSDFASIDLLSNGNYTLQVETLSGIQLFDATGEEINKVEATIAVVKDAPLDIALGGATVSEDAATDAVIGSLSALSSEGAASNVTYELIDDDSDATNNAFKISNGNLVVDNANILNYEENTSIELKIEASSGDRSGIETFAVSVTDANDAPVAPSDLTFSVGAGAAQDAEVGYNFTATDEDGDTLAYEIQSQKDSQGADVTLFGINSATGILTAASAIANSDAGDYTLVIGFTDNEGGQGTATVTATVVDNIPPVVSNSDDALTATLSEDASVGAAVFSITGTDDDGEDSAITFDISGNDKFEVNETTGAVTLKSSLDYEGLSTETFNIFAIDEEGTSSAAKEVTVTVTDANDAPVITSGATGADLNETALKGAAVYTTVATDQDAGDTLTYSLSGTDAASFAISSAGAVTLNGSLDYETKATYEFNVVSTDADGLADTVAVTGNVIDRPEHPFSVETTVLSQAAGSDLEIAPGFSIKYLDGASGDAGDIKVTISTSITDLDTSYSEYEAIEIVEMSFDVDGVSDVSTIMVEQSLKGLNTATNYNSLTQTVAAPTSNNDVGVTGANMVTGTDDVDLFYFMLDSSKIAETSQTSFDITLSGYYQLNDTDGSLGSSDVVMDPFVITVDIA
jgi:hypothetical protein